jgi:dolichyl-phosphate beta-glucosyltransferase
VKKINISIIFPFYNEVNRLKNLFLSIKKIQKNLFIKCEFIFVNDGSTDCSYNSIKYFLKRYKIKNYQLITYSKNKGKGYAIKTGVIKSKFEWILTSDIDLSVKLDFFLKWFSLYRFKKNYAYFGSRNLKSSKIKTIFIRKIIGKALQSLIYIFIDRDLTDTQCGYKIYNNLYAKKIFRKLSVNRFSYDIEVIQLLKREKIKIVELPVHWKHVSGGKVNLITDSIKSLLDLFKIIFRYSILDKFIK